MHLCSADHGGAGSAAFELHKQFLNFGVTSNFFCIRKANDGALSQKVKTRPWRHLFFLLLKVLFRFGTHERFTFRQHRPDFVSVEDLQTASASVAPDVIVVHFVSEFLSFTDLAAIADSTKAKIVFHVLDMGIFTGGCHYSWECRKYESDCSICPALPFMKHYAARVLNEKIRILDALEHLVIAPTHQLQNECRQSRLFKQSEVSVIALGIEKVADSSKAAARRSFGICEDETVVMFGCQKLHDPRKGMELLYAAMRKFGVSKLAGNDTLRLLVVGDDKGLPRELFDSFNVTRLGHVNRDVLNKAYLASSVFVCPSIEDSGPLMACEAIVAGTPIVGFRTGILPELVTCHDVGKLADEKSSQALFEALTSFLEYEADEGERIHKICSELGQLTFSVESQTMRFLEAIAAFANGEQPKEAGK